MFVFCIVNCITLHNSGYFLNGTKKNNFGKKHMSIANLLGKQMAKLALTATTSICVLTLAMSTASAGDREKAKFIHDRIAGVSPTNAVLASMTANITGSNTDAAIDTAMNNINFLNVTVKNMVIPWTNKEQTVFFPFNDAAATLTGYIRDGRDFRGILFDDLIYTGNDGSLPGYSTSGNNHYIQMEHQNLNLRTTLQSQPQTLVTGQPSAAVAGVLTTRASARAFFFAGTNRAMFRYTMLNYLCTDLEQVKDITRINDRIRQDVSRDPGGDSDIFLNNCIGCHSGQDGMAGAFAYHQWGPAIFDPDADPEIQSMTYVTAPVIYSIDGVAIESATRVTQKHRINPTNFSFGRITADDSWINYWRTGVNAKLGWGKDTGLTPTNATQATFSGSGAAALGRELANTEAFARCQVIKVYRHVCHNDPAETDLQAITTSFAASTYNMQTAFKESIKVCMGTNPNL